jgi:hypothetical protein
MHIGKWVIPPMLGGLCGVPGWAVVNTFPFLFQLSYFDQKFNDDHLGKGEYAGCFEATAVLSLNWTESRDYVACINDHPSTDKDANCEWKYVCKYYGCGISDFEMLCIQTNISRAFMDARFDYEKANVYVFPLKFAVVLGIVTGFCFSLILNSEEERLDPQSEQKPGVLQRCSIFFTAVTRHAPTRSEEENLYQQFDQKPGALQQCSRFFARVTRNASTQTKEEIDRIQMINIVCDEGEPLSRNVMHYGSNKNSK